MRSQKGSSKTTPRHKKMPQPEAEADGERERCAMSRAGVDVVANLGAIAVVILVANGIFSHWYQH
jgi:hypothetical protein